MHISKLTVDALKDIMPNDAISNSLFEVL